jgi:AcrR family transcriptional regulator
MQNANVAEGGGDDKLSLVDLAARRSYAQQEANSAEQVDRLLSAGVEVMRRNGTTRQPRVSEIVLEAGLSNVAFYKYFPTKDDLVAAIIEAGALRLVSYLDHQMRKHKKPEDKIASWIEGSLSQASGPTAEATRAVMWNGKHLNDPSRHRLSPNGGPLANLLEAPLLELGSLDPAGDATMIYFAVSGRQWELLWRNEQPTAATVEHAIRFCLAAIAKPTRSRSKTV